MAERTEVIKKLDQAIEGFIENSKSQSADFRMKKLAYYTALRNGIDMMPLNAPQIEALARCEHPLDIADCVLNLHTEKGETEPDYTALSF